MPQVTKQDFASALKDLGHDPKDYEGKKMTLDGMVELYGFDEDIIIDAIDRKHIAAHYDYKNDTIWVDALDAAHFFYCVTSEAGLYA